MPMSKNNSPVALAAVIKSNSLTQSKRRGFSSTFIVAMSAVTLIMGSESVLAEPALDEYTAVLNDESFPLYEQASS